MGHSDEWTFADYFRYEKEIYRAIISAAVLCQWIAEHDTPPTDGEAEELAREIDRRLCEAWGEIFSLAVLKWRGGPELPAGRGVWGGRSVWGGFFDFFFFYVEEGFEFYFYHFFMFRFICLFLCHFDRLFFLIGKHINADAHFDGFGIGKGTGTAMDTVEDNLKLDGECVPEAYIEEKAAS